MAVDLLALPQELLVQILAASIRARGLKRGMRLRLVCKTVDKIFRDALFETDVLDLYDSMNRFDNFDDYLIVRGESYYDTWQSYLLYRTFSPTKRQTAGSQLIRATAEAYCQLAGASDHESIRSCARELCELRAHSHDEAFFKEPRRLPITYQEFQLGVLVACVCMDNVALARDLVATIEPWQLPPTPHFCQFDPGAGLFTCPSQLATRLGRHEILQLFLELNPEPYTACNMTALGGDGRIDTLEFLIRFKSPDEYPARSHKIVLMHSNVRKLLRNRNPEMFARVERLRKPSDEGSWTKDLRLVADTVEHAARKGSAELLNYIYDLGVPVNPPAHARQGVLATAARLHRIDVVKLLLERGADLEHRSHRNGLPFAVLGGSLAIVRLFLDHGVDIHRPSEWPPADHRPIVLAILLEHVAIFKLLKEHGALTQDAWNEAMEVAKAEGLESMVNLLSNVREDVG